MELLTLKYPFGLLPFNNAYSQHRQTGRRFLTKQGKEFKNLIEVTTRSQCEEWKVDRKTHWLEVEYFIYSPKILTKEGFVSMTKGDLDGAIKLFQDSVCKTLGFDDSVITQDFRKQIYSPDFSVIVIFKQWPLRTINDIM